MNDPGSGTRRAAIRRRVKTIGAGGGDSKRDQLAAEEPLEIRVATGDGDGEPVSVTMRTPGNDFELAAGFLHSEGVVGPDDVRRVVYCDLPGEEVQEYNVVTVHSRVPAEIPERRFPVTSACGVCGRASLDDLEARCRPLPAGPEVTEAFLVSLPEKLLEGQRVFAATGGLHAAGYFDLGGSPLWVREDIGRHNAVDKVVGAALLAGALPLPVGVMVVSGRAGFEIVQKSAAAGARILVAVSAPSSLAVGAAERLGQTLVAFARDGTANLYTHPGRVLENPV